MSTSLNTPSIHGGTTTAKVKRSSNPNRGPIVVGGTSTSTINQATPTPPAKLRLEVIIVVMGMMRSGKSSFIKLITGDERIKIGHGVVSETREIGIHYWTAPDRRLCALVDTPGFDDSNGMTDTEVLDKIASFLKRKKINGLIYCQRIDVRAGGLTIRNLRLLENICGLAALKNVAIVTTRWDVVGNTRAVELEQELKTGERYFKPLCDAGASTFGHDNTLVSAWQVMYKLLSVTSPVVFQIQEELMTGMTLDETAAGSQLNADLDAVIKRHEGEIKKVREEMEDAMKAKDEAWKKELDDELTRLKEDIARLTKSKEHLSRWHLKSERLTHSGAGRSTHSGAGPERSTHSGVEGTAGQQSDQSCVQQ